MRKTAAAFLLLIMIPSGRMFAADAGPTAETAKARFWDACEHELKQWLKPDRLQIVVALAKEGIVASRDPNAISGKEPYPRSRYYGSWSVLVSAGAGTWKLVLGSNGMIEIEVYLDPTATKILYIYSVPEG